MTRASWLLANFHALGARVCAERLDATPERVIQLYREALRRTPVSERWPISRAFWLYELRHDFTDAALADMLSMPVSRVRERLELLEAA